VSRCTYRGHSIYVGDWLDLRQRLLNGFIALGIVVLVGIIDGAVRGPNAARRQSEIVKQLGSIPDPSDASVIGSWAQTKTSNGTARRVLISGRPASEVKSFYVTKLQEQGWQIQCEPTIEGRDRTIFIRDSDTVVLSLPLLDSEVTGEYSIDIVWGINYC
jgi:hypothetical protein